MCKQYHHLTCSYAHITHKCIVCEMYQNGWTPLICAANNGQLSVVAYLVERGAHLEAKNNVSEIQRHMRHLFIRYVCDLPCSSHMCAGRTECIAFGFQF